MTAALSIPCMGWSLRAAPDLRLAARRGLESRPISRGPSLVVKGVGMRLARTRRPMFAGGSKRFLRPGPLINEGRDAPGVPRGGTRPAPRPPGALPRKLLLPRKIFTRPAKFASVQKKVSTIPAPAGTSHRHTSPRNLPAPPGRPEMSHSPGPSQSRTADARAGGMPPDAAARTLATASPAPPPRRLPRRMTQTLAVNARPGHGRPGGGGITPA
jgi:hypothetical protein